MQLAALAPAHLVVVALRPQRLGLELGQLMQALAMPQIDDLVLSALQRLQVAGEARRAGATTLLNSQPSQTAKLWPQQPCSLQDQ